MHEPAPHDSATRHVTGEAVYTDDIREPAGTLQAYVRMSDRAHARLVSIDTAPCREVPGVRAVAVAADVPGVNDIGPVIAGDPILAEGEVQYVGQPILAVAAETLAIAREAAMRAVVVYEDLPAVLSIEQALAEGSQVSPPLTMRLGDAAAAVAAAPHRLTGEFRMGGQDHFYLEGQIALAIPGEEGELLVHSSTQHPSEVQHMIAHVLNLTHGQVTVEVRRMGGGFGGKETQPALIACLASLLATKTRRPVKLRLDRDDDMQMTGKRHDFLAKYDVGYDDEGRILGVEMDLAARCGYSADLSNAVVDRAMFHADNCYFLGNARVTGHRCKTHTVSNTAFRGFGGPQGMIAIENVVDEIARRLGRDPLDVRRLNFYGGPGRDVTHFHQRVEDSVIAELVDTLERTADYRRRVEAIRAFNAGSPVVKRGIALTPVKFGISFTVTHLNQAGALVNVYTDGSVLLNHGGTEMGQGLHTKVAQVVADEFGIDLARVKISATSTGKVPNTSATAASSGTDLNGMAAQAAARTIKNRLIEFAAGHFKVAADQVAFRGDRVHVGATAMEFGEFVRLAYMNRVSLSSTGYYRTPKIHWDRTTATGRPFYYFAYGASVTEAAIDTLTGESRILRADLLHDVGRSLNPALDLGQIEGGYIQGVGWLTAEELFWDDHGRLRTHAPSTYKIPTCRDIPPDFRVAFFENSNREDTIGRSKAVGEPPFMLGNSAFLAIKDAVAAVGDYRRPVQLDAPATPERVLAAVEAVRGRLA
ncbi:MAG TPA: xanthine dehydrogenase molybdopterin binding subunit [Alphaproteobacteria bacterium]|nr:xanthine dehydrogenase molybdopterin binding subunit [Alphaproteobacteria bacterium]